MATKRSKQVTDTLTPEQIASSGGVSPERVKDGNPRQETLAELATGTFRTKKELTVAAGYSENTKPSDVEQTRGFVKASVRRRQSALAEHNITHKEVAGVIAKILRQNATDILGDYFNGIDLDKLRNNDDILVKKLTVTEGAFGTNIGVELYSTLDAAKIALDWFKTNDPLTPQQAALMMLDHLRREEPDISIEILIQVVKDKFPEVDEQILFDTVKKVETEK